MARFASSGSDSFVISTHLLIQSVIVPKQTKECGGCTWVLDENGVLINQGPAGCGSGCWNLDLSNKGITSIPPAAFSGTNLNATLRIL